MNVRLLARCALGIGALVALLVPCLSARPVAAQETWPSRPVRIVVATGPGVSNDLIARWLAERLAPRLGRPFLVENRAGASGAIAVDYVLQQPNDGYTIFYANAGNFSILPALDPSVRYDPERDFVSASHLGMAPHCLLVRSSLAANTLQEFVALARANPGQLTVATSGPGTAPHMNFELLAHTARIQALLVPFRTTSQGLPELVAGRVDAFLTELAPSEPYINAGQIRCLAITGTVRWPTRPDVPNFVEAGYPLSAVGWGGLVFRAGTPAPIVERFSAEVRAILHAPGVAEQFRQFGHILTGTTPAEMDRLLREDRDFWRRTVRVVGAARN